MELLDEHKIRAKRGQLQEISYAGKDDIFLPTREDTSIVTKISPRFILDNSTSSSFSFQMFWQYKINLLTVQKSECIFQSGNKQQQASSKTDYHMCSISFKLHVFPTIYT